MRGANCPKCNSSRGETKIDKYLKDNNIKYESQKKFDECKYKNKIPFDFYLPDYNLCIEFDGVQHFEPVNKFGGEEALKINKEKDSIKNKFCKDNNIDLLRIHYTEINNITNIIKEKLKI